MPKKICLLGFLFVMGSLALYAVGVSETDINAEYATKTYTDRSEWLYEFNQIANKVHTEGLDVAKYAGGQYSGLLNMAIINFDNYSYRYKVLLDLGVQYAFIDDITRQQQLAKLKDERDKVSSALSQASGLGL
jgi:hypothetical protein